MRRDVAMTGEITLRGRVLPDRRSEGEAARGAPRRDQDVLIPKKNEKDLIDIPKEVRTSQIRPVDTIDQVLKEALIDTPAAARIKAERPRASSASRDAARTQAPASADRRHRRAGAISRRRGAVVPPEPAQGGCRAHPAIEPRCRSSTRTTTRSSACRRPRRQGDQEGLPQARARASTRT